MRTTGTLFAAALLLAAATAHAADSDRAAARDRIEAFHGVLLECMQNADALGFEGRNARMRSAIDETFDVPFMARGMLGRTWKTLDAAQRADFVALSRRLSAARYADNFSGYSDQRFETRSVEPAARGTLLVRTELVQPRDRDVKFDYRLRKVDGQWRVIDILLDGQISELALWRGQYKSVLDRDGFPGLRDTLETRIDELSGD